MIYLKRRFFFFGLLVILSLVITVVSFSFLPHTQALVVKIAPNSYVHDQAFSIVLNSGKMGGVKIYYTLDGSEPGPENETAILYDGRALRYKMPAEEDHELYTVVVRARAFTSDLQEFSPIATSTYFYGHHAMERFSTLSVSIVTDPQNLFSQERGILHEDNVFLRGGLWERAANVSFFENKNVILQQEAGLRLHGFSSRGFMQKSWRLSARRSYDPQHGTFEYPFFDDYYTATDERKPLTEFNKLIVRGPNNDLNVAFVRDEVGGALSALAGFETYQASRPVATYLNGEYAGLSWLKPAYDEHFLADLFELNNQDFQFLEFTDWPDKLAGSRVVEEGKSSNEVTTVEDLAEITRLENLFKLDLKREENYRLLVDAFDVEQLLQYYALKTALSDNDWPHNNIKIWRYSGEQKNLEEQTQLDGRWRFLPYDFDLMLSLTDKLKINEIYKPAPNAGESLVMAALLERRDAQEIFANYLNDYRAHLLGREQLYQIIEKIHESARNELAYGAANGRFYDFWYDANFIRDQQLEIVEAAYQSAQAIRETLPQIFNLSGQYYQIRVTAPEGIEVVLNSISSRGQAVENFVTEYNREYAVALLIKAAPGFVIDTVSIDGEAVAETSSEAVKLKLSADLLAEGKNALAVLVTAHKITKGQALQISEIYNRGQNDWLEFYNPNTAAINLGDYCLTDNPKKLCQWRLPEKTLAGQSHWTAYSQDNKTAAAWRQPFFPFNLGVGEELILSKYDDRKIVTKVVVPRIGAGQRYHYDQSQGFYRLNSL